MTNDIFESLQKEVKTKTVRNALNVAYWRGVANHKTDPLKTETKQKEEIEKVVSKT